MIAVVNENNYQKYLLSQIQNLVLHIVEYYLYIHEHDYLNFQTHQAFYICDEFEHLLVYLLDKFTF